MARRKRSLSGSPERHQTDEAFYTDAARSYFKDVASAIKDKDCTLAFPNYTLGVQAAAKAFANSQYAPISKTTSGLSDDAYRAEKMFRKACVRGFEKIDGLSGTRRRRSRR